MAWMAFCLLSLPAWARQGQVSGRLVDASTQETLPFATVRAFSEADSALASGQTTDMEGRFSLSLPYGRYYLLIDFVGYQTITRSGVVLEAGQASLALGDVAMKENEALLSEVEVVGERMAATYELDRRVYNVAQASTMAGTNASQLLDNLPSVQVDMAEGTISLRGSANVRILIDGKPAALSGMSSAEALRNLQSDMIERVEVVTNPSARYDAEGEAGVINIVLKKNRRQGINGSFSLNAGWPANFGASASLNFRKEKVNFFGSYGVAYRNFPGYARSMQRFIDPDTSYYYRRNREHVRGGASHNARVGLDYYVTPSLSLTGSVMYNTSGGRNEVVLQYLDFSGTDVLGQEVGRTEDEEEDSQNWGLGFSMKKTFERKGHEWTFDAQWADEQDLEVSDLFEQNRTFATVPDIVQRSSNTENQQNWFVQSAYIRPFAAKAQFEAGFRANYRLIENAYLVEQQEANGWFPLPDFNNDFTYTEQIGAAYAMLGNDAAKVSWQVGLRAEHTFISTELAFTEEYNEQRYLNLFPSGHIAFKFSEEESLQLSYSRRLSRPGFRWLLPFSNFSDSRNFRAGNPALRPEFTDAFEVGWLQNWETGSLMSSAYYRYRTQVIQRITTVDDNDFTVTMPVNLSFQHAVGLEFSWTQDVTKFWTLTANANVYREQTEGSYAGERLYAEAVTMNGRASSKWKLSDTFDAQANFRYSAPRNSPQGKIQSMSVIDLAFAKNLWKGKGTLTLAVQDLLNSQKWRSVTDLPDYYAESEFQWRARQVVMSFTYRLNQQGRGERGGRRGGGEEQRGGDGGGGDF
jgi:outer membrane receptor protein involved in Fe transport